MMLGLSIVLRFRRRHEASDLALDDFRVNVSPLRLRTRDKEKGEPVPKLLIAAILG
jgi:hypothetical protein